MVVRNLACVLLLFGLVSGTRAVFLTPNSVSEFKVYSGQRKDTKIILSANTFSESLELPRFFCDVVVYSPLKLTSFLNYAVLDKDESLMFYNTYITDVLKEEYSFAYCYLQMLDRYQISLPVSFHSKDINYDLDQYFNEDETVSLSQLNLDQLSMKDKNSFLGAITVQAKRDTLRTAEITSNCIMKVASEESERYLWGYFLTDHLLYVIDPCYPSRLNAYVDLKTNEYSVGTKKYKLQLILKKLKAPVEAKGGAENV